MIYVGIDPDANGAMAMYYNDKIKIIDYVNIDDGIKELKGMLPDNFIAYIEKVHAMPMQGVSSTFKFGTTYGIWQGILKALRIKLNFVTPQQWQKSIILNSDKVLTDKWKFDTKAASMNAARRLFPNDAERYFKLKKHHGRADAACILKYAMQTNEVKYETKKEINCGC